jgi:tRNA-specific 2-thiouridylase
VGQRRHLGVAVGHRTYVTGLDAASATVQLGSRAALLRSETRVIETSLAPDVSLPLRCEAVVRYRARPAPAIVDAEGADWRVRFAEPIAAVVPGQALVLYDGDRVLGGGIIAAPSSSGVGIEQPECLGSTPA